MEKLQIWGDSILKGVVFDEARNRYAILRENCVAQLAALLPCTVENHARMGCTAPQAMELLLPEALSPCGLALIEYGSNDCAIDWPAVAAQPDADHQPQTPLADFARLLTQLVSRVREAGMQAMLAVPPPLHAQRYFDWVTRDLNREAVLAFLGGTHRIYRWQELYAQTVFMVASRLQCPVLNLREAFLDVRAYEDLLCVDGMHPNARGHQVMLDVLKAAFV